MADKDYLDKNGTSYLWNKAKQKIDAAKTTVDNYTINGKKVSGSPVLSASDVGAAPLVGNKIPAQYIPTAMDDVVYIMNYATGVITEDELESVEEGRLTTLPEGWSISEHVYYESTLQVFYVCAWSEDADSIYFQWDKIGDLASSDNYGDNKAISVVGKNIIAKTKSPNVIYRNVSVDMIAYEGTGEEGKVYVDTISNKTYRWGGSSFVIIGTDLALGETSETAFAGDKGKEVYDAVFTKNMPVVVPEIVINSYSATDQSGNVTPNTSRNGNTVTIERGIKLSYNVAFRWNSANGYKDPTAIVAGTTWYDASKEKGGLPLKGVLSASKTGTTESALTLTAKVSAPKIGLMVDSNNNVTKAEGNDVAENSFKVSLTYRRYFGVIANGSTINEELIKGLSSELNTSRGKTIAINVNDSQQYVYAYESALNEASISKGVEDEKAFWTTGTLNITNQYGKTISYRYYVCGAGAYKGVSIKFG